MVTTSAYAADAVVYNEPVAPIAVDTFSWTGGYIGVNAGYAGGRFKTDITEMSDGDPYVINYSDNASGFVGGVQIGYNWQMEQFVLGLETDIQASGVEAKFAVLNNEVLNTKIDWFGTTRVRLGFTPVDRFMVYATGGVAYGKIKMSFGGQISDSDTRVGYTIGAGAEHAINNNWTWKGEYLYTDLGKLNLDFASDNSTVNFSTKSAFHTFRLGLNYKF